MQRMGLIRTEPSREYDYKSVIIVRIVCNRMRKAAAAIAQPDAMGVERSQEGNTSDASDAAAARSAFHARIWRR